MQAGWRGGRRGGRKGGEEDEWEQGERERERGGVGGGRGGRQQDFSSCNSWGGHYGPQTHTASTLQPADQSYLDTRTNTHTHTHSLDTHTHTCRHTDMCILSHPSLTHMHGGRILGHSYHHTTTTCHLRSGQDVFAAHRFSTMLSFISPSVSLSVSLSVSVSLSPSLSPLSLYVSFRCPSFLEERE